MWPARPGRGVAVRVALGDRNRRAGEVVAEQDVDLALAVGDDRVLAVVAHLLDRRDLVGAGALAGPLDLDEQGHRVAVGVMAHQDSVGDADVSW